MPPPATPPPTPGSRTRPPPSSGARAAGTPAAVKHWRSFGDEEWRHVQSGAQGLLLGSVLPVFLFYIVYRGSPVTDPIVAALGWSSFTAAIVVVLGWSALIFGLHRRRTGSADVFSALTFVFACLQALIGLVSQDPFLYLAAPSLENMLFATAFLGSAAAGRPILSLYAQRLYPIPLDVRRSAAYRRAFLVTSGVWFVGLTLRALLRLALLRVWSAGIIPLEWYLVVNTVSGWPINIFLVSFTVWFPLRALQRAGLMHDGEAEAALLIPFDAELEADRP